MQFKWHVWSIEYRVSDIACFCFTHRATAVQAELVLVPKDLRALPKSAWSISNRWWCCSRQWSCCPSVHAPRRWATCGSMWTVLPQSSPSSPPRSDSAQQPKWESASPSSPSASWGGESWYTFFIGVGKMRMGYGLERKDGFGWNVLRSTRRSGKHVPLRSRMKTWVSIRDCGYYTITGGMGVSYIYIHGVCWFLLYATVVRPSIRTHGPRHHARPR